MLATATALAAIASVGLATRSDEVLAADDRVPAPAITIVASTNGADAIVAPGPSIPVGSTVTWTYLVTNTGNVALDDVAVTDDRGVVVTCPTTTLVV